MGHTHVAAVHAKSNNLMAAHFKEPELQAPPICGLFVYNLNKSEKASVQPTQMRKEQAGSWVRSERGPSEKETTWKQLKTFDIIRANGPRYVDKNFGWLRVDCGH